MKSEKSINDWIPSGYKPLIMIPMLNLLVMHYFFYINNYLEWTWLYSAIINIFSIIFDISIMVFIALIFFGGRIKPALVFTQILTLIWSFINVIYGRFFFQYISMSAIGEAHSLGDKFVINSILSAFHWSDSYYIISSVCFILFCRKATKFRIQSKVITKLLYIPALSILATIISYSIYHFVHPHYRNNWELYSVRIEELLFNSVRGGTPNLAHFHTGCIRVGTFEIINMYNTKELTKEERKEIYEFYKDSTERVSFHKQNPETRNVIIILLESFLSAPIDLIVDGKEVTPFLNSLKKDTTVYYNGKMKSDIGCGESGDGQFIYMNGILPYKNIITVGQIKDNTLPALPIVLKKELAFKHTEIIFPSDPNLWQQADMNIVYGLDEPYSIKDIVGNNTNLIDDKKIFDFASKTLNKAKEPFFSLILSVSTHSPYDKYLGDNLFTSRNDLPKEYRNYLNTCHFTDTQLKTYFNKLKKTGIYNRSLIIIASDHYAHIDRLNMQNRISDHIPLFIINGQIDIDSSCKTECHQLDVYTTIMDIFNINNEWKGLGHTLLSPNYNSPVNEETYRISNLIIEGDYFKK